MLKRFISTYLEFRFMLLIMPGIKCENYNFQQSAYCFFFQQKMVVVMDLIIR